MSTVGLRYEGDLGTNRLLVIAVVVAEKLGQVLLLGLNKVSLGVVIITLDLLFMRLLKNLHSTTRKNEMLTGF